MREQLARELQHSVRFIAFGAGGRRLRAFDQTVQVAKDPLPLPRKRPVPLQYIRVSLQTADFGKYRSDT